MKVIIESVHELSNSQVNEILSNIGATSNTEVELRLNKTLIAGLKISYKGLVIDKSLKNQLNQLQTQLVE